MNDMTTNASNKPAAASSTKGDNKSKADDETGKVAAVTLDQLAREMKMPPRDARMLLRLAAKQTKLYPTLGKEHVARQPWSWAPGSKSLDEARRALSTPQEG